MLADLLLKVVTAHIWRASAKGFRLKHMRLHDADVSSVRNVLFLLKPIEKQFDAKSLCILYNPFTVSFCFS